MLRGKNRPRGGVSKLLSKPLRKVVGYSRGLETLECGHEQLAVSDIIGETNATRRRCRKCPDVERKAQPVHKVERWDNDTAGWVQVFEGPADEARERYDRLRYVRHRARRLGANGRVLDEGEG